MIYVCNYMRAFIFNNRYTAFNYNLLLLHFRIDVDLLHKRILNVEAYVT